MVRDTRARGRLVVWERDGDEECEPGASGRERLRREGLRFDWETRRPRSEARYGDEENKEKRAGGDEESCAEEK